nr:immunoglobulin heavy chain junction region [Mus musculus]
CARDYYGSSYIAYW